VQPQIVMQRVPAQIRRQIVDDPTQSLFYKPFKSFPASIAKADQERLQKEAQDAIREHIVPSYKKFAEFFDKEYFPHCFTSVGAWQLPQGDKFYAHCARSFTTTSLTPDEIHEIGLKEVARIRAEMERIKEKVKFQGSLLEFFEHLRHAPEFYFTDAKDLLTAYQAFCKRVDPQLPKMFKTLPRIPYGVEPIPEHMAPDTTAAYYRPPAADGSRAGTYFVNLYKPEARPKYEIAALSLHEAVPGHHLQIAIATELQDVPEFRKQTGFTAFVEGWALYSESLGEELGVYDDPYSKFGQLTYEMWRAIRLVVDTGLHHKRWTREQAIDYFRQNSAKTELDIVNEVDRYIGWPGQALAYKIGELKIKELRDRAKTKLGTRYDQRTFHDVILRNGAVPLDVLETQVDQWIAEKQK
jgi:prolyl oligopeptidase